MSDTEPGGEAEGGTPSPRARAPRAPSKRAPRAPAKTPARSTAAVADDGSDVVDAPSRALGFGFVPDESQHHFLVSIPATSKDPNVYVTEHFEWDPSDARRELHFALGREEARLRVVLPRAKWDALADALRGEFNARLRALGHAPGRWATGAGGRTPVQRSLGKELVLLCWAMEDADPSLAPTAVRNWLGLAPEERWWLYGMTNAATGHAVAGRGRGWRRAVRYALTDNPVAVGGGVTDAAMKEGRQDMLSLFSAVHESERRWGSAPGSATGNQQQASSDSSRAGDAT